MQDSKATNQKISAFLARKARQHPDVFDHQTSEPTSVAPRIIKIVFA